MIGRGRPPKPIDRHDLEGTFRADRHGAAEALPVPEIGPEKPSDFDAEAAALWDFVMRDLRGVSRRADTLVLAELCRWYSRYRRAAKAFDECAVGPESRLILVQVKACWDAFDKCAALFGLAPAYRMKLRMEGATKKSGVRRRQR